MAHQDQRVADGSLSATLSGLSNHKEREREREREREKERERLCLNVVYCCNRGSPFFGEEMLQAFRVFTSRTGARNYPFKGPGVFLFLYERDLEDPYASF